MLDAKSVERILDADEQYVGGVYDLQVGQLGRLTHRFDRTIISAGYLLLLMLKRFN